MARNGSGVRKATEKTIEIQFQFDGKTCRERVKAAPTAANIRKLEVFRDRLLEEIAAGTFDYAATFQNSKRGVAITKANTPLTLGSWLNQWLDAKEKQIHASTYAGYRKIINTFPADLLDIELKQLKKPHVKSWCKTLTCTNKTIKNKLSVLQTALMDAVDDEILDTNPLTDFRYENNEPPRADETDPFTRDEAAAILAALTGQHKNYVQFAFWTGMRTSELVALEWGDIDMHGNQAHVQRAKTQDAKAAEAPKTKAGTRKVKLLPPALAALADQKQYTFLEGARIFKNPNTGKNLRGDRCIRKFWSWALKRAGVRYRNPYQTRHTYASWMLSSGESLPWIAGQMGHSSVIQTASAYARFIPDAIPEAGNKAVEMFAKKQT